VLTPIKGKSLRDGLRPPLTVTGRSVRRKIRLGRGDTARQSNKEMTGHDGLDTNRPIQVLGSISPVRQVVGEWPVFAHWAVHRVVFARQQSAERSPAQAYDWFRRPWRSD
jgi:hypothetical protein